ncbi:MAG: ABC transporter substrate-binding protein/permease [candidate division KSB1 bacterium]|nr:ABC transporter substrate-binding protein/permease [candidate division KSB1 bacterium]MDZ7302392.1 ABC transporter substrate-binding protein/permease [candidate division KSB1 bacterium]MDZ7311595.1 ABC transporter substrate-binding protein/permease [candidate division KSB1 bacterium]
MITYLISLIVLFSITASTWAQTSSPKILRWGADSEGGAPYAFQDPADPGRIIGFEVDLVNALAEELHVRPEFVQNQWDGLIPGLQRGNYDMVVNGLEITEDRKAEINFSEPYYLTYEQLTVRKDTYDINSLADCKGKVVGTLKFSLAHRILEAQGGIEVRSYEGQINAYEDLANGRLDAVLMDYPIALYYGQRHPKLKFVGGPISQMTYGIGVRKEDRQLLDEINLALEKLAQNGRLREILERWALWTVPMAEFLHDKKPSTALPTEYDAYMKAVGMRRTWKDRFLQYAGYIPLLAKGALTTIELSILSMLMAVVLGLLIALMRLYTPPPFSQFALAYVEVTRGTPLLIQLFFIFYGLPNIGIKLAPFTAALLGLGLNYAAYEAENYRAGILSIPRSQMEAALALGMTRLQALRHIIVPQAMRLVIPPVTNDFIALLKDSSLVSVITMVELTKVYGQLASTYYDYFGIGLLAAAMYFLIGLPFVRLSRFAENYFSFDKRVPNMARGSKKPRVLSLSGLAHSFHP